MKYSYKSRLNCLKKINKMRGLTPLIFTLFFTLACSKDEPAPMGFSNDEFEPLVTFTHNGQNILISNTNSGLWTNHVARDEQREEIDGLKTKGFGSVSSSDDNGRFMLLISRWITEDEIDYVLRVTYFEVLKTAIFENIFSPGKRQYARNVFPIFTSDEVLLEFTDKDSNNWQSSFRGNTRNTPPYNELQPSADFEITRSMAFGSDSILVEAKFKARLYKNESEYFEINDGYFRGYFFRTIE